MEIYDLALKVRCAVEHCGWQWLRRAKKGLRVGRPKVVMDIDSPVAVALSVDKRLYDVLYGIFLMAMSNSMSTIRF